MIALKNRTQNSFIIFLFMVCIAHCAIQAMNEKIPLKISRKKKASQEIELSPAEQKHLNKQLIIAAKAGTVSELEALISQGADVNSLEPYSDDPDTDSNHLTTALHEACWNNHIPVVHRLLQAGASVNIRDSGNNTPLNYIGIRPESRTPGAKPSTLALIDTLLYAKADIATQNPSTGETLLHHALRHTLKEKIYQLILAGADAKSPPNNNGKTPWDIAYPIKQEYICTAQAEKALSDDLIALLLNKANVIHDSLLPLPYTTVQLIAEYATAQFSPLDMARFDREKDHYFIIINSTNHVPIAVVYKPCFKLVKLS